MYIGSPGPFNPKSYQTQFEHFLKINNIETDSLLIGTATYSMKFWRASHLQRSMKISTLFKNTPFIASQSDRRELSNTVPGSTDKAQLTQSLYSRLLKQSLQGSLNMSVPTRVCICDHAGLTRRVIYRP